MGTLPHQPPRRTIETTQPVRGCQVSEMHSAMNRTHHEIDVVITLGGDGLLMHANWLFQRSAPVILPVNLGQSEGRRTRGQGVVVVVMMMMVVCWDDHDASSSLLRRRPMLHLLS
jgi:hypothetical protein